MQRHACALAGLRITKFIFTLIVGDSLWIQVPFSRRGISNAYASRLQICKPLSLSRGASFTALSLESDVS